MVKCSEYKLESYGEDKTRKVIASLIADTKEEVVALGNSGVGIEGLFDTDVMTLGSTAICSTGDFGILNSDGVWNF